MGLYGEHVKTLPHRQIFVAYAAFVKVGVIVYGIVCRYFNLCIRTGDEVHVFSRRQRHDELLDERAYIPVAYHRTFPFFYAKYAFRHFYFQVAFYLALASETPMVFDLLACEVRTLGVKYLASAFQYLHLALSAARLSSTCRRKEYPILVERTHQRRALRYGYCLVAVDFNVYIPTR